MNQKWYVEEDGTTVTIGGEIVITRPAPDAAPMEEVKSNARLIAAAPELLEALNNLIASVTDKDGALLRPSESIIRDARAAIAKAEGRTE